MVIPLALFIEYLTVKLVKSSKWKKHILINSWQILGILFPTFWLLRNAENYTQGAIALIIIVFFGVYKPTKYKV